MNWDALGAFGELVGAAAVIATLIYLGKQIAHSVDLTRTSQRQAIMDSYANWNELILSQPDLRRFMTRMQDADEDLTPEDEVLGRHFIYRMFNIYNNAQAAFDTQLITADEFWFFENDILVQVNTYPGLKKRLGLMINDYPNAKKWQIYKNVIDRDTDERFTKFAGTFEI